MQCGITPPPQAYKRSIFVCISIKATTERVESEIHRPDILIEVNAANQSNAACAAEPAPPAPPITTESLDLSFTSPNSSQRRQSEEHDRYEHDHEEEEEEEDTVICTASDTEMPAQPTTESHFTHSDSIHVVRS